MLKTNHFTINKLISKLRLKKIMNHKIGGVIVTLLCVTSAYIVMYHTMGGYFLSNDDTGMMKTVSGYSSGVPTSYHQFMCTALGVFFESLYIMKPDVSWYSHVYVGIVIVSISTMLYVMIRSVKLKEKWMQAMGVFAVTVYVSAITLFGVYNISWTETSTFCGSAALALLLTLTGSHSKKTRTMICVVSGILVVLNALVRFTAFLPLIPFYIVAVIYVVLKNQKKFNLRLHIIFVASVMMILGALYIYSSIDREYKETQIETVSHSDFDVYRSHFSDYPIVPYEGNEEFYQSIGWDKSLYTMAHYKWMYIDRRFNTENLKKIYEMSKNISENQSEAVTGPNYNFLVDFYKIPHNDNQWFLLTLMVTGFALLGVCGTIWCLIVKKRKYLVDSLMIMGINLLSIFESLYAIMRGRYIFRVFLCSAIPAFCISTVVIIRIISNIDKPAVYEAAKNIHQKVKAYVLIGVTFISLMSFIVVAHQNFNREYKIKRDEANVLSTAIERYCVVHKENLYVHNGISTSDSQLFLDMSLRGCSQNLLFWGGTGVFSAGYYDTVGQYGYSEFFSENLFDEKVYFICDYSDIYNTDFYTYMRALYGEDIRCEQIESIRESAFVYKFSR